MLEFCWHPGNPWGTLTHWDEKGSVGVLIKDNIQIVLRKSRYDFRRVKGRSDRCKKPWALAHNWPRPACQGGHRVEAFGFRV